MENFLKIAFGRRGLSDEEELELVREYQRTRNPMTLRKIQRSLQPFLDYLVDKHASSNDDNAKQMLLLEVEGHFREAIESFDEGRGVKLNTYLENRIGGRLQNEMSKSQSGAYVPRNQGPALNRYREALTQAQLEHGRNPTDNQIKKFYSDDSNNPFEKIKRYHVKNLRSDKTYKEDPDGDPVSFQDQFTQEYGIDQSFEDDNFKRDQYESKMQSGRFSNEEKEIIRLVEEEGKGFVDVALSLGVSTGKVRKTVREWNKI